MKTKVTKTKVTKTDMDILIDNPENEYMQFDKITQKIKEKYEYINDPFFKYNGEVEKLIIQKIFINKKIDRLIEYYEKVKKEEEKNAKNGKKSRTIQKNSNKNKKNKCKPNN